MSEINKFEQALKMDLTKILRKKGSNEYIPWASAIAEFFKMYPEGDFEFIENEQGTYEFGNPEIGYLVKTKMTTGGESPLVRKMSLPVMDFKNQALLKPKSTDVNKALMRCLAKNVSLYGFALTTYAGEEYFQSEIGEEADALREEITNLAVTLSRELDARDQAVKIIGHGGKVGEIKDVKQLTEVRDKLGQKVKELSEKKTKTTKKTEEK